MQELLQALVMKVIAVTIVLANVALGEYFNYEGYKVYRVDSKTDLHKSLLNKLRQHIEVDFFSPKDVMVAPNFQNTFTNTLEKNGVSYKVLTNNLQEIVEKQRLACQREEFLSWQKPTFSLNKFNRLEHIYDYLYNLENDHYDTVKLKTMAYTYENRELLLVEITDKGMDKHLSGKKPAIFIEAGIHAREWLAPAVALYVIKELAKNTLNRHLIKDVVWYIAPVLNPDGYVFTHTKERFWRKNRRPGKKCYGVDLNRNYDYHWGEGSSFNDACNIAYHGPHPFSEIETSTVRDFLLNKTNNVKLYISLHSFSQVLLIPYSYTARRPNDYVELKALADNVTEAMAKVNRNVYVADSLTNLLGYMSGGTSMDWVKEVAKIRYSYCIELPPLKGGIQSFHPRRELILPTAKEIFAGLKVFHDKIVES